MEPDDIQATPESLEDVLARLRPNYVSTRPRLAPEPAPKTTPKAATKPAPKAE